jgi:hypothetical protein
VLISKSASPGSLDPPVAGSSAPPLAASLALTPL